MKLGILSDVHGNIYGLQTCYDFLKSQKCDKLIFLGDAIHYFGKSHEVLRFLQEKKIVCIRGNHEEKLLNNISLPKQVQEVYNTKHVKKTLTDYDFMFMKTWKTQLVLEGDGMQVLFVHGSPWNYTNEYIYPSDEFTRFMKIPQDIICMGHTHIPFIKKIDKKTIINVGSAGYRRDKGNLLSCVTIDTKTNKMTLHEFDFPLSKLNELQPFHKAMNSVLARR
jgi:putative phosphoesterase